MERVQIPAEGSGKTCRTCRKWDGRKCCDMRHKHNDDPDRPCRLYRYRNGAVVAPSSQEARATRKCPECGRERPLWAFVVKRKSDLGMCADCRAKAGDMRFKKNKEGR